MVTFESYSKWLIDYVKANQNGNFTNPISTTPEIDARAEMMIEFNVSEAWAYELIRQIVAKNRNVIVQQYPEREHADP